MDILFGTLNGMKTFTAAVFEVIILVKLEIANAMAGVRVRIDS